MSTTYDLLCRDCKRLLTVGQGYGECFGTWRPRPHVPQEQCKMDAFLIAHQGHHLTLLSEHAEELDKIYSEILSDRSEWVDEDDQ